MPFFLFQVQFRSQHLKHYMFKVIEGEVEIVESLFGKKLMNKDGQIMDVTSAGIPVTTMALETVALPERALNPKGYAVSVKIRYDQNFKDHFGGESINTIRKVVTHAQNMWRWPSLTIPITFDFDPSVDAVSGRFVAKTDLKNAGVYSSDKYNVNVMMAFRNNSDGVIGVAYIGTVCSPPGNANIRVALCEYFVDDLLSGENVAHEIGHNMNMRHDFIKTPGGVRLDSKGKSCTNIGGIMDYFGTADKWTSCSVEDFTALANQQGFCLKNL